jgi:pilus assembly protein CpaF
MFAVVITEKGGAQRRTEFDKSEVTIGRVQGNDIILPKGNVSKRHSRIVLKDNRFIVVDLKSTNGTYVNGRKITSPLVVKSGDKIYIGDFIITLEEPGGAVAGAPVPVSAAPAMGPPPMGPPPMGPPPMGPPPMGPPPMGPPPMGPPPMGPPPTSTLGGTGPMGPPPMAEPPAPPRPASMRPPAPAPRPSMPGAPPPPLARAPEPTEPPPLPPGGDRFKLDEEPADADETMAPSPRVLASARPRVEPPPAAAPMPAAPPVPSPVSSPMSSRGEPQAATPAAPYRPEPPRHEPPRAEPPRAEAPRAEPPRAEPAPALAKPMLGAAAPAAPAAAPALVPAAPAAVVVAAAPAERLVEVGSLGPLAALLDEVGVLEIVAEGPGRILVDRGNGLTPVGATFASSEALAAAAARLFAAAGGRLVHDRAVQEVSLPDGASVLAVLPPFAVGGPYLEVRRLGRPPVPGETLVAQSMLSAEMLATLRAALAARRHITVIGPSDAGVPQLLAALVAMTPASERILCVEASPELALPASRAVRFAAASAGFGALIERVGALRSDRLVLDGVTGEHVRAALVALAARSGGSLLGVRAPSVSASLEQLAALAALAGGRDGAAALAASATHLVVRMSLGEGGVRRVDAISELQGDGLVDLFEVDESGFSGTGARPSF